MIMNTSMMATARNLEDNVDRVDHAEAVCMDMDNIVAAADDDDDNAHLLATPTVMTDWIALSLSLSPSLPRGLQPHVQPERIGYLLLQQAS